MANLKTVSEPKYHLELDALELRTLQALVGSTSGSSLRRDLNTVFHTNYQDNGDLPPEFAAVGTLWNVLEPKDRR